MANLGPPTSKPRFGGAFFSSGVTDDGVPLPKTPRSGQCVPLDTRWTLVGCSTGRLAGFAPLRILATYSATRRKLAWTWIP